MIMILTITLIIFDKFSGTDFYTRFLHFLNSFHFCDCSIPQFFIVLENLMDRSNFVFTSLFDLFLYFLSSFDLVQVV